MNQGLFNSGRGGLTVGGPTGEANPEMAAYYNSLANQQRQIAAGADTAAQNQIKFGQGLLTDAYSPFNAGLGAQKTVEGLGQQSLTLGTEIGQMSTGGSQKAGSLLTEQTDPTNYALQKLLGNQQLMSGVGNWFSNAPSWTTGSDVIPQSTFSGSGDSFAFDDSWANPASSWNTGSINGLF
jgi:hypothetical protein